MSRTCVNSFFLVCGGGGEILNKVIEIDKNLKKSSEFHDILNRMVISGVPDAIAYPRKCPSIPTPGLF